MKCGSSKVLQLCSAAVMQLEERTAARHYGTTAALDLLQQHRSTVLPQHLICYSST
jgi:hypothetical protein